MWTSTTWRLWTQRCIATFSSSKATRVTWKSSASTSLWSTTIWEKLRWLDWIVYLFFTSVSGLGTTGSVYPSSCLVALRGVNNSFPLLMHHFSTPPEIKHVISVTLSHAAVQGTRQLCWPFHLPFLPQIISQYAWHEQSTVFKHTPPSLFSLQSSRLKRRSTTTTLSHWHSDLHTEPLFAQGFNAS